MAYTSDLRSLAARRVGSSPTPGTSKNLARVQNMAKQFNHDNRVEIKNGKPKLIFAVFVLVLVFFGLNTKLFVDLGIFNFQNIPNVEELDIDVSALNKKLAGTQEGVHFLEGMVISVMFANPGAGMLVGFLKESYDIGNHYRGGTLNNTSMVDGLMDLTFWILGALAGFYAIIPIHAFFIENKIKSFRDLVRVIKTRKEKI